MNRDDKAQQAFKQLEQTPIWKGLKAVKKNQVYPIADQPWLDYSALGNKMAMDEAKRCSLNKQHINQGIIPHLGMMSL